MAESNPQPTKITSVSPIMDGTTQIGEVFEIEYGALTQTEIDGKTSYLSDVANLTNLPGWQDTWTIDPQGEYLVVWAWYYQLLKEAASIRIYWNTLP